MPGDSSLDSFSLILYAVFLREDSGVVNSRRLCAGGLFGSPGNGTFDLCCCLAGAAIYIGCAGLMVVRPYERCFVIKSPGVPGRIFFIYFTGILGAEGFVLEFSGKPVVALSLAGRILVDRGYAAGLCLFLCAARSCALAGSDALGMIFIPGIGCSAPEVSLLRVCELALIGDLLGAGLILIELMAGSTLIVSYGPVIHAGSGSSGMELGRMYVLDSDLGGGDACRYIINFKIIYLIAIGLRLECQLTFGIVCDCENQAYPFAFVLRHLILDIGLLTLVIRIAAKEEEPCIIAFCSQIIHRPGPVIGKGIRPIIFVARIAVEADVCKSHLGCLPSEKDRSAGDARIAVDSCGKCDGIAGLAGDILERHLELTVLRSSYRRDRHCCDQHCRYPRKQSFLHI